MESEVITDWNDVEPGVRLWMWGPWISWHSPKPCTIVEVSRTDTGVVDQVLVRREDNGAVILGMHGSADHLGRGLTLPQLTWLCAGTNPETAAAKTASMGPNQVNTLSTRGAHPAIAPADDVRP